MATEVLPTPEGLPLRDTFVQLDEAFSSDEEEYDPLPIKGSSAYPSPSWKHSKKDGSTTAMLVKVPGPAVVSHPPREITVLRGATYDLREKRWFDYLLRAVPFVTIATILAITTASIFFDLRIFFAFATVFVVFNLWVQSHIGIYLIKFFRDWLAAERRDFRAEYTERRLHLVRSGVPERDLVPWEDTIHYVAIANYKEHLEQLADTMNVLSNAATARTNIVVMLAMEERESEGPAKAEKLRQQFADKFLGVVSCHHPPGLDGEIPGKESNVKWAVNAIAEDAQRRGIPERNVCITIADADTYFHPLYFDCLTAKFCNDVSRDDKIWQGPMACYKNYMTVPAPTRLLAMLVTVYEMASLSNDNTFRLPFSSYSASLTLHLLAPYDGSAVAEDWHKLIKAFFASSGRVKVEPLPFPNLCWAVESDGWFSSVKDRYIQAVRHAWGITEIIYFLKMWVRTSLDKNPRAHPPIGRALSLLGKMTSIHMLSGVGFYFMVVPMLLMSGFQYIPALNELSIAPMVLGSWSIAFRILFYLAFIPMAMTAVMNFIITKRLMLSEQVVVRWYHIAKWIFEIAIVLTPVNLIFGMIPTVYSALKAIFTENFVYITAAKPTLPDNKV